MSAGTVFHWRGEGHRIIATRHHSGLVLVIRERDCHAFGLAERLIRAAMFRPQLGRAV